VNAARVRGKSGTCKGCLRDEQLTSPAGVVRVPELARHLGVEQSVKEELHVKQRERGSPEGQASGGLVYNLLLGGDCLSVPRSAAGRSGHPGVAGPGGHFGPPDRAGVAAEG
jgi:hypothetical protein